MELAILIIIVLFILSYRGTISFEELYKENEQLVLSLKEKDYDFLVLAKYGESVNPNDLFMKRLKNKILSSSCLFRL